MEEPKNDPEAESHDWTSLRDLLRRTISPGAIATAIEKQGISGWDRFGRFHDFEKDADECKHPLDLLAAVYAYESTEGQPNDDVQHPLDECAGTPGNPFELYGWRTGSVPKFDEEPHTLAPARSKRSAAETKERQSLLVIIAGLMKQCKIERGQPGTVKQVKSAVEFVGASMDEETIRGHLANIDEAIELRSK